MNADAFLDACRKIGLDLNPEQLRAFEAFEERLYEANEVMNLTRVPRAECWTRHFLDSLVFHDLIPANVRVLDIGSGPGFPAWPLACARPDLKVTALDSNGKMMKFLGGNLLPNLTVLEARAESWDVRDSFEVVTGRALAPLPIQLELSAPPCIRNGVVIPLRTPNDTNAIENSRPNLLGLRLEAISTRPLPGTDIVRLFPTYRKVGPTPSRYPRSWSEIKRNPIG